MTINFNRTVAYMCARCGEVAYGDFSIFSFSGNRGISVKCGCGKSSLKIYPKSKNTLIVSLPCLICDEEHEYEVPMSELMHQKYLDFSCPEILVGLASIGKDEDVATFIKENEQYINEIVTACGLNHTGKNGLTMLKALDKIQEVSDEGRLSCHCGSKLIDIDVLEDELILKCCDCGSKASFTADEIRNGNFSKVTKIMISKSNRDK